MWNDGTITSNGLGWLGDFGVPMTASRAYPAASHSIERIGAEIASGSNPDAGSTGTASSSSVIELGNASSPFVIDASFDPSITNLATSSPTLYAEITGAITAAIDFYESEIITPITIGIDFGFGNVGTFALGANDLGESLTELLGPTSYNTVRTALIDAATSADDASSVAALGTTDPTNGGNFMIAVAEAEALGLAPNYGFAGYVGLSSTTNFDYNPSNRAVAGETDAIGVLEHEITEVMGRIALLGEKIGTISDTYSPLDLFRFSSPGTRSLVGGHTAFFSVNGGTTALAQFNTISGQDYGDWASSVVHDSFDAASGPGVANTVSATDLREMDVLGYTLAPACFAAGTRVRTLRGDIPVEELAVGDHVHTRLAGITPIRWIGRRRIDCRRHAAPNQVRPIRIVADAFAPGRPHRDLLLSPDHAVQVEDCLVAIRHLANGMTIRQDCDAGEIEYFHVELDRHDILEAEGLQAESYLDTGNRGLFENADEPLILFPDLAVGYEQALREAQSCLPMLSDPIRLQAVWQILSERALGLGFNGASEELTDEPDLGIAIGHRCLGPVSRDGCSYTFVVPSLPARLTSRSAIPAERRPWIDEQRRLGVMVRRIVIRTESEYHDIALDDPRLSDGWWAPERDGASIWRWTNGGATLPPVVEGPIMLDVTIGDAGPYPLDSAADEIRNAA